MIIASLDRVVLAAAHVVDAAERRALRTLAPLRQLHRHLVYTSSGSEPISVDPAVALAQFDAALDADRTVITAPAMAALRLLERQPGSGMLIAAHFWLQRVERGFNDHDLSELAPHLAYSIGIRLEAFTQRADSYTHSADAQAHAEALEVYAQNPNAARSAAQASEALRWVADNLPDLRD